MLTLYIKGGEQWNGRQFTNYKDVTLTLEHSLISISKWESKFHKPFLSSPSKTDEEALYYIKCMAVGTPITDEIIERMTQEHINAINDYIDDPMTATVINKDENGEKSTEMQTSELLYHYMIALEIPFECQKWHLNRLITLIELRSAKQKPPEKMTQQEIYERNRALNAERRAKMLAGG